MSKETTMPKTWAMLQPRYMGRFLYTVTFLLAVAGHVAAQEGNPQQDRAPENRAAPANAEAIERAPFESPLTPQERRWLMDQYERRGGARLRPVPREEPADVGAPTDVQRGLGPELRRIQRELGGSAVEAFPWQGMDNRGSAKAQAGGDAVAALRGAAWQLDVAANRLEWFNLFQQADALREQAQRLRLDARGMMEGPAPKVDAAPQPELAPLPESDR
jgi:hypothetical protein